MSICNRLWNQCRNVPASEYTSFHNKEQRNQPLDLYCKSVDSLLYDANPSVPVFSLFTVAYSERYQTSKIEIFAKLVHG